MRFVSKLAWSASLAAILLASSSAAQVYPRATTEQAKAPRAPSDLRRRAAGSSEKPTSAQGFYTERVANGMGNISAMVSMENGSLYALDRDKGVLWHLADRGLDGRIDTQRRLSGGFERPTGLTLKDDKLYVSDTRAIWQVNIDTGEKTHFVSLSNINAGEDRPLLSYENRLLLGLSRSDTLSQVLSVDGTSGEATHLTDIPEAPIRALSYGGGRLWAAVGGSLRPVDTQSNSEFAKHYPLEPGAAAMALTLPSEETNWPKDWPAALRESILAIQGPARTNPGGSGGNNIIALPTQFGAPLQDISVLVGGFLSRDGRSAWAAPTAMLLDSRGLFFADRIGGSLWRVKIDDRPTPTPRERISKPTPAPPVQKPSLKRNETVPMVGSMIGESSVLEEASTLKVGSYLKKEHDDAEAAKLEADKAAEEAKAQEEKEAQDARRRKRLGFKD